MGVSTSRVVSVASDKGADCVGNRPSSLRRIIPGVPRVAEILDQAEVDALFAAVAADAPLEPENAADGPSWTQPREDVQTYDFKRPERVTKDQMRVLQTIHEGFARNFGASLSGLLRTIAETRVATVEQMTYHEFIFSLPSPTCFNLLSAEPLTGTMCLEISPLIIYPIVDRLLGGSNAEMFIPQRALTAIELRLANRIIERVLANLREAWTDLADVQFAVTHTESNPHLVQIVAPNEIVIVVSLEIKLGARAGTMALCIPFNVIEPVIGKMSGQGWLSYSRRRESEAPTHELEKDLALARIQSRVYLGEARITLRELMSLAPGDIVRLEKPVDREFVMQIEGRNKYAGRLGQMRGHRALRITRRCQVDESL